MPVLVRPQLLDMGEVEFSTLGPLAQLIITRVRDRRRHQRRLSRAHAKRTRAQRDRAQETKPRPTPRPTSWPKTKLEVRVEEYDDTLEILRAYCFMHRRTLQEVVTRCLQDMAAGIVRESGLG